MCPTAVHVVPRRDPGSRRATASSGPVVPSVPRLPRLGQHHVERPSKTDTAASRSGKVRCSRSRRTDFNISRRTTGSLRERHVPQAAALDPLRTFKSYLNGCHHLPPQELQRRRLSDGWHGYVHIPILLYERNRHLLKVLQNELSLVS